MSEGLLVALITVIGTVIGAIIGGVIARGRGALAPKWILMLCTAGGLLVGLFIGRMATQGSPPSAISPAPTSVPTSLAGITTDVLAATATAVPSATQAPTNPPTPSPAPPTSTQIPTQMPTPTPTYKPGDVLYQADWSGGRQGWAGPQDWKTVDAMLINNGQSGSTLRAPYETGDITDYAVEAEIQMVTQPSAFVAFQTLFGIFGRASTEGAYWAGFDADFCGYGGHAYAYPGTEVRGCSDPALGWSPFKQDTEWHIYRLEMKGNKIQLLVDGSVMVSKVDNTYLSGNQVGLWSQSCQINVRSFKVIKL